MPGQVGSRLYEESSWASQGEQASKPLFSMLPCSLLFIFLPPSPSVPDCYPKRKPNKPLPPRLLLVMAFILAMENRLECMSYLV